MATAMGAELEVVWAGVLLGCLLSGALGFFVRATLADQ
jgi:hypothetical protein